MELDDIRRQHRLLAGVNPFSTLATDDAAPAARVRPGGVRQAPPLARPTYVEHAARPADLGGMMVES
jgi:hypothetical protein